MCLTLMYYGFWWFITEFAFSNIIVFASQLPSDDGVCCDWSPDMPSEHRCWIASSIVDPVDSTMISTGEIPWHCDTHRICDSVRPIISFGLLAVCIEALFKHCYSRQLVIDALSQVPILHLSLSNMFLLAAMAFASNICRILSSCPNYDHQHNIKPWHLSYNSAYE